MDPFEFFVEGPPLSQQTRNSERLREWKEYVRTEAAKLWLNQTPVELPLKLTVVYYHERQSVLIDHDNMIKPIQDALAGLIYRNDRQITDAQTRKTNIDGRFRLRRLSAVLRSRFRWRARVRLYQNRRGAQPRGTLMTSTSERESRRLASVASEYQERGYEVTVQPRAADLPDFMAGFHPDLIATGNGESIVVEIKARNEFANNREVTAIEAAIRNRPGWRFELIIDGLDSERGSLLGPHQIETSLKEADELQVRGHVVAALLLLWSATEGTLRLLAARERVELESSAPGYMTKRLYTLGLLGREQYRILDEAVRLRNQAAHGFQVSVTQQDLARVAAIARELLTELQSKAA